MTILVVDVGNTSTAVGLWTDGRVSDVAHFDGGFTEAADGIRRLASAGRVSRVAYISVVPAVDGIYAGVFEELKLPVHVVSHGDFPCEVRLCYPRPETIGADRLADAAGAVARYGAPVLVMDFGTALTAAVVTADGVWRGGVIAPGFPLMRDYLYERTAKLPQLTLDSGKAPEIGRSTEEAMRFGVLVGYRGMVREFVTVLSRNFRTDFRLVATGGFGRLVLEDLDLDFTYDADLTLYGAGLICSRASIR